MSDRRPPLADRSATPAELPVTVASAVCLTYLFTANRVDENLLALGVLALFGGLVLAGRPRVAWPPWAVVTCVLLAGIIQRPLDVPNHHFMLTYTAAALAFSLSAPAEERLGHLRRNARWLLVVLMGFATVQKVLSPTFVDGSYLGFALAQGSFGAPLLAWRPETHEIVQANRELVDTLREAPPWSLESVQFEAPFANLRLLSGGFGAAIVAIELWLCVGMWWRPAHWLTHLSLLLFVVTLGALRQEFQFISVVCTLGLLACEPERNGLRFGYAALALAFAAAVLKTLDGL